MKDDDNIGDRFQRLTAYSRKHMAMGSRPAERPEPFKEYPGARTVALEIKELPDGSLWKALATRRSRRAFIEEPISLAALSLLVFAAQGATARAGRIILRAAPSAGALYPVETYVAVNRVSGIEPGLYHYNVRLAALEELRSGGPGRDLAEAALGQDMCARAAAVFIFSAAADRCKYKYAQRAWRYIYLDAGHACENLLLAAEDLGLGSCAIGAFCDDDLNAFLEIDGESETAIYLAAVGPVKQGAEERE